MHILMFLNWCHPKYGPAVPLFNCWSCYVCVSILEICCCYLEKRMTVIKGVGFLWSWIENPLLFLPHVQCHCYPLFQGIAFQLISLAWPRLLRTSTEPRRVIWNILESLFLVQNCVLPDPNSNPQSQIIHSSRHPVAVPKHFPFSKCFC